MKKISRLVVILTTITIFIQLTSNRSFNDFGMNKPHLLFHLGERHSVSVNYGLAYWLNNPQSQNKQYFTKMRFMYENTNNGLYVNMVSHDGDEHIHQIIEDKTYNQVTNVRYQLLEDGWQQKLNFELNKSSQNRYGNHTGYWATYMTVQNCDPKLIDHKQYSTAVKFHVLQQGDKQMIVEIDRYQGIKQTIRISSRQNMKVFGFTMNISQSYDARGFMDQIKHLIQLNRYKNTKRKNDSKLVEWQNNQLKLIKKNIWNQNYVILVFYGEYQQNNQVIITNKTTTSFNDNHFDSVSKQINQTLFPQNIYPEDGQFLRHILFNLYGGSAFYYGVLYTQNSLLRHELDYSYTFTPSRLIFPRGFLWDDGFHLSVALHYNPDKTLDIIHNWLRKIDLFGWIGRQQIRGFEISSMMPQVKFVYQDIFQMNPPTLILPIISLIQKANNKELEAETEAKLNQLLQQNFWKLQKWYRYFVKTQSHNNLMENQAINRSVKYRWRCKDDCQRGNFMGSGLDDYPRTATQTQISKQHVDLMSWIYFFSEGLEKIANHLKMQRPIRYYEQKKKQIQRKIIQECLDPLDFLFKDQSIVAKNQYINDLVTKIGYINLFPFFTGILKQDLYDQNQQPKIKNAIQKIIEIISSENHLFSEGGIRSLSISDKQYGTLDNYWRGSVWLPINYMILRACKKYYWHNEKIREVYVKIRKTIIKSVKQNWLDSGYLYENYQEGKGNRGFPFYGWTSLIINIITENY